MGQFDFFIGTRTARRLRRWKWRTTCTVFPPVCRTLPQRTSTRFPRSALGNRDGHLCVNLKCDPERSDFLWQTFNEEPHNLRRL